MVDGAVSSLWPVLHYDDTEAARTFLVEVLGLREALLVRDDDGDIVHSELRAAGGGALVFGGTKHTGGVHSGLKAGALYLATDDVDAIHQRALDAGAEVVAAPHDTKFRRLHRARLHRQGLRGQPLDPRHLSGHGRPRVITRRYVAESQPAMGTTAA